MNTIYHVLSLATIAAPSCNKNIRQIRNNNDNIFFSNTFKFSIPIFWKNLQASVTTCILLSLSFSVIQPRFLLLAISNSVILRDAIIYYTTSLPHVHFIDGHFVAHRSRILIVFAFILLFSLLFLPFLFKL